jgi:DNA invertase Pin-like site-specific DNA recombinase
MTAAIYARVSTVQQKTDMQLDDCRRFAKLAHGWKLIEYLETESSVKRRPVLERMMQDARLKKFDVVVVWKLDRIARSMKQFIDLVLELDRYGIRFVSVTQKMIDSDQKDPMGRFLLHLFAALAEFERGLIVERVRSGVAAAKARGKHCGRPKKIFRRDEALALRRAGKSYRAIAAAVGADPKTIRLLVRQSGEKVSKKPARGAKQTKR